MTIACLLRNTLEAACLRRGLPMPALDGAAHEIKTNPGRFFEDFALGETIRHATPRTVTAADAAL